MKRTDLDLASRALGGSVRYVSDEFFAACEALLMPAPPVHDTTTFGPHGKIYDGWETRRRRTPGYDWAVVALGVPGTALAYLLFFGLITGAGAAYASLVTYLIPPIALAYGAIFLGERFGAAAFGGLALILAGVALGTGAVSFARLRRQPARS